MWTVHCEIVQRVKRLKFAWIHVLPLILFGLVITGCQWKRPHFAARIPVSSATDTTRTVFRPIDVDVLALAEAEYAAGSRLSEQGDPQSLKHFVTAARNAWQSMEESGQVAEGRAAEVYQSSVSQLLVDAQRHHLWRPEGVQLVTGEIIQCKYRGFTWTPDDFQRLIPVGDYGDPSMKCQVRQQGIGVPLVVVRNSPVEETFFERNQPFPATVVLKPAPSTDGFQLEFIDPRQIGHVNANSGSVPLATDLSAPYAYWRTELSKDEPAIPITGAFSTPYEDPKLVMLEPYRAGATPLVFVHGLGSAPMTWLSLVSQFERDAEFRRRYQVWVFRYSSTTAFLTNAARMREGLIAAVHECQSRGAGFNSESSNKVVLVGHSLGGILSKLQVAESGTQLWDSIAKVPLEQINTDEETRERLRRAFFFEPLPFVEKVVFIGSPHKGSSWASRLPGRIATRLTNPDSGDEQMVQQLLRDNPGVFSDEITTRVPTSLELLRQDSRVLEAIYHLKLRDDVILHNIVGTGRTMLFGGPADGVVPVSSAQHPNTVTETRVNARHMELHTDDRTAEELKRILQLAPGV